MGGCDFQRSVTINGSGAPPKLVLNSEIIPGRPWRVDVSRSVGSYQAGNPSDSTFTVTDATVSILHGDQEQSQLRLDSLRQYSARQFLPEEGEQYTVRVSAPNLETATATDRVPHMPPTTLSSDLLSGEQNQRNRLLQFTIDDPPGVDNYYHIALQKRAFVRDSASIDTIGLTDVYFETSNRSIIEEMRNLGGLAESEFNFYVGRSAILTDVLFGGTRHTVRLRVNDQQSFLRSDPVPNDGFPRIEYRLYVSALSEDLYQFLHTRRLQNRTEENPFAEPVEVHSNVNGGYGIVAGRATDTLRVEVEE